MPSWELFDEQDEAYRDSVLPPAVTARVAVEAGIEQGWQKYLGTAGRFIGMSTYGAQLLAPRCSSTSASRSKLSSPRAKSCWRRNDRGLAVLRCSLHGNPLVA